MANDIEGINLPAGQVKVIDMLSENIFLKQSANLTIYGAELDTSSPHKKLIIKNHGTYFFSNRPFTTDMQVVCQITDTDGTVYYGVHDSNYDETNKQAIGVSFVKKTDLDPLIDTSAVQSGNTIDGLNVAGGQKFVPEGSQKPSTALPTLTYGGFTSLSFDSDKKSYYLSSFTAISNLDALKGKYVLMTFIGTSSWIDQDNNNGTANDTSWIQTQFFKFGDANSMTVNCADSPSKPFMITYDDGTLYIKSKDFDGNFNGTGTNSYALIYFIR